MNTSILQKCLDELSKDAPKLDYVRGMLETLIEMQPSIQLPVDKKGVSSSVIIAPTSSTQGSIDEAAILESETRAKMAQLKNLQ